MATRCARKNASRHAKRRAARIREYWSRAADCNDLTRRYPVYRDFYTIDTYGEFDMQMCWMRDQFGSINFDNLTAVLPEDVIDNEDILRYCIFKDAAERLCERAMGKVSKMLTSYFPELPIASLLSDRLSFAR